MQAAEVQIVVLTVLAGQRQLLQARGALRQGLQLGLGAGVPVQVPRVGSGEAEGGLLGLFCKGAMGPAAVLHAGIQDLMGRTSPPLAVAPTNARAGAGGFGREGGAVVVKSSRGGILRLVRVGTGWMPKLADCMSQIIN